MPESLLIGKANSNFYTKISPMMKAEILSQPNVKLIDLYNFFVTNDVLEF